MDSSDPLDELYDVALEGALPSAALMAALDDDEHVLRQAYAVALDVATVEAASGGEAASQRLDTLLVRAAERAARRDAHPRVANARRHWVSQPRGGWLAAAIALSMLAALTYLVGRSEPATALDVTLDVRDNRTLGEASRHAASPGRPPRRVERSATLEVGLQAPPQADSVWLVWKQGETIGASMARLDRGDGGFTGLQGAAVHRRGQRLKLVIPARHFARPTALLLQLALTNGAPTPADVARLAAGEPPRSKAVLGFAALPPIDVVSVPSDPPEEKP